MTDWQAGAGVTAKNKASEEDPQGMTQAGRSVPQWQAVLSLGLPASPLPLPRSQLLGTRDNVVGPAGLRRGGDGGEKGSEWAAGNKNLGFDMGLGWGVRVGLAWDGERKHQAPNDETGRAGCGHWGSQHLWAGQQEEPRETQSSHIPGQVSSKPTSLNQGVSPPELRFTSLGRLYE